VSVPRVAESPVSFDCRRTQIIARHLLNEGGGPADYFEIGPDSLFHMRLPVWP